MAMHSIILTWRIPRTEELAGGWGGATVHRVAESYATEVTSHTNTYKSLYFDMA